MNSPVIRRFSSLNARGGGCKKFNFSKNAWNHVYTSFSCSSWSSPIRAPCTAGVSAILLLDTFLEMDYHESIRATEPWKPHIYRLSAPRDCNFIYSLLGIETWFALCNNYKNKHCNFIYSLLGIETIFETLNQDDWENCNFIYSLLGIETWCL